MYYARRLADENALSRICELCDDYLINGYSNKGKEIVSAGSSNNSSEIMGIPKINLLKKIIPILAVHNSNLQKVLQPYIDALKSPPGNHHC